MNTPILDFVARYSAAQPARLFLYNCRYKKILKMLKLFKKLYLFDYPCIF